MYATSDVQALRNIFEQSLKIHQSPEFVATELQSNLVVEVGDFEYYLFKFPLFSRSGRINQLVFQSRDTEKNKIRLENVPGGPEAFEMALKFCYGIPLKVTALNVAALRCAAGFLEMTDDLEEGNLITKTEAFLNSVVLPSWKDSIAALRSCEHLSPLAENLKIVQRCCESVAWKACTDPRGIRSPYSRKGSRELKKNGGAISKIGSKNDELLKQIPQDWWFEDVLTLCIQHFVKVMTAMQVKGMRSDWIGAAIIRYAVIWLPDLSKDQHTAGKSPQSENRSEDNSADSCSAIAMQTKNLKVLQSIVKILPQDKDAIPSKFLLHLIGVANLLNADVAFKSDLEKRVGSQLEHATLGDLLVPAFGQDYETFFDVELVHRIFDYFFQKLEQTMPTSYSAPQSPDVLKNFEGSASPISQRPDHAAKIKVSKLLDSYLAEIAKDKNLSSVKFQAFAEALPDSSRPSHDGLYRAIDIYLKNHPTIAEHDRKKLCRILDCQKLSSYACTHAAQNERLPIRMVVQVLYAEQMKLRSVHVMSGSCTPTRDPLKESQPSSGQFQSHRISTSEASAHNGANASMLPEVSWAAMYQEVQTVKMEMRNIKAEVMEFRKVFSSFQQQIQQLSREDSRSSSGWKKLSKLASVRLTPNKEFEDKTCMKTTQLSRAFSKHTTEARKQKHSMWRLSFS
ncbi:hypothetical protein O6H91_13G061200 [Diphasiastrum complanatum]|uniref:Uncharacterized protein n=1 Tax=Diphasiastrum complanatum TaxID=34168 RepID=A0ACC2BVB4_DIPCM|nr:hypothetical protein O6H91_13G061200 [Diphasiastrum complanatum]